VLVTPADGRADWLRAGQALHRLLAHAATKWVFASLHSQPLEAAAIRSEIRARLKLPGAPQMLLQLGLARTTRATARRPPAELMEPLAQPKVRSSGRNVPDRPGIASASLTGTAGDPAAAADGHAADSYELRPQVVAAGRTSGGRRGVAEVADRVGSPSGR